MDFKKFIVLFKNTIQNEYRSKTLVIVSILTIALIFLVNAGFDMVMESMKDRPFGNFASQKFPLFIFIISIWTTLLSILFGVNSVKSDFDNNVISQFISLPVRRFEYLLARILGSSFIIIMYYLASVLTSYLIFTFSTESGIDVSINYIAGLFFIILVIISVTTITAFISVYTNKIVGLLLSSFACLLISVSDSMFMSLPFKNFFDNIGVTKFFLLIIYMIFPHIKTYSGFNTDMLSNRASEVNVLFEVSHFFFSYAVIFTLFSWYFSRKEI